LASLAADAAIEHALATIANEPTWRSNYISGIEYPAAPIPMNGGSFTWRLIDADGNLADDESDCVTIQGIAIVGRVQHRIEVIAQPVATGLSALEAALHCNTSIDTGISVDIWTDTIVSSNANISANGFGESIAGNAEAAGAIAGNITGTETPGIPPRQMPDSSVFDYYLQMGTKIDLALLAHNDHYDLEDGLLSPVSNPWGLTNPEGIYFIDCAGQEIRIKDLRVFGTLCLINPGPDSRIEKEVLFEPATPNFPSLLINGSIAIEFDSSKELKESGVNFNPPGAPYDGETDNDTNDEYPSLIRGLVYVSGQMNFVPDSKDSDFDGVVICGAIAANSDCRFDYDSVFLEYPPPGFGSGNQMEIIPGSWRRAESP
jgi:hypothetical protein